MMKLAERDFLIEYAVRKYNRQYGRDYTRDEFDVRSITPRVNTDLGYEFTTNRLDDFVRLRIYFSFGRFDDVRDFKLEVNYPSYIGKLGDETFVALGTIDRYYLDSGIYKFRWIGTDTSRLPIFVTDEQVAFVDDRGRYFKYHIGEPIELGVQ